MASQEVKVPMSHREHGRAVLEGVGQAGDTGVVGKASVAVAGRQGGVEEGLLGGVVRLRLVLLRLRQRGGRRRRRGIATAKLRQVACWRAPTSEGKGRGEEKREIWKRKKDGKNRGSG